MELRHKVFHWTSWKVDWVQSEILVLMVAYNGRDYSSLISTVCSQISIGLFSNYE